MKQHPVRRKDRQIDRQATLELLTRAEYGILSTVDAEGQPYGIPLSYAFDGEAIYIHCAHEGHKLENLAGNPRVSFCVVGKTRVMPEEFGTVYESAILFGKAVLLEGEDKRRGLRLLAQKYSPKLPAEAEEYINKSFNITRVVRIEMEHVTGKARKES